MGKQINFTDHNGKAWTLEFNRRTSKELQQMGFSADDIADKNLIMLPMLWRAAFLMHHRGERTQYIDDLLEPMENKLELFNKLTEMYNEPVEALISDPVDEAKKVNWTASW